MVTYKHKRSGKTIRRSKPSPLMDRSKRWERVDAAPAAKKGERS